MENETRLELDYRGKSLSSLTISSTSVGVTTLLSEWTDIYIYIHNIQVPCF